MATLDLKDAYYLIPIAEEHKKYLRFLFNGQCFEFNCLPFGLNTAPWVFTKIMKPVICYLREVGHLSVIYLDDILLLGLSRRNCQDNVDQTCALLNSLVFIINTEKSKLSPSRHCSYLGLDFYSESMTIQLSKQKSEKCLGEICKFWLKRSCKIRDFASFIGSLGSCCQATKYGWAHLKDFERIKYEVLRDSDQDYNQKMILPVFLRKDFDSWKVTIIRTKKEVRNLSFTIFSDASLSGWGACCGIEKAHGQWNQRERKFYINALELLAALFGQKCFASQCRSCDILLRIGNTTAIAYINKMGGIRFKELNEI